MAKGAWHYKKLIQVTEQVIKTYRPDVKGVDTHAAEALGIEPGMKPNVDQVFTKQVLYGCVRYKKVLKIFLASFYFNNSATTSRSDYTMYMIFTYITLFRLDELGFETFENLVMSQENLKMHVFLDNLFDLAKLEKWVKTEWCKIVDIDFLENEIFGRLNRFKPAVTKLLKTIGARLFGKKSEEQAKEQALAGKPPKRTATVPKPFDLHKPRKLTLPMPIRIEQKNYAREPAPELLKPAMAKMARKSKKRLDAMKEYTNTVKFHPETDPRNKPFPFHETRKTGHLVAARVKRERESKLHFDFKALPMPTPPPPEPVRLTAAAILREDALYRQKQAEQARLIKNYESDLRDSSTFYRWQSEMKQKDEKEHERLIEQRRKETALSAARAIEARHTQERSNLETAEKMKAVTARNLEKVEREKEQDQIRRHVVAQEMAKNRKRAPRAAKAKLLEDKKKKREVLEEQMASDRERKAARDAEEQKAREDMIRQIRALERAPKKVVKVFDPTESVGMGLLEEMSLYELRERLQMGATRREEEQKRRRERLIADKASRQADLQSRLRNISRIRASASNANKKGRARRLRHEAEKQAQLQSLRETNNRALAKKLKASRQTLQNEKDKLHQEGDRVQKQRLLLGSNKQAMERRHFQEQLKGTEREARERQQDMQDAARRAREVQSKDNLVRAKYGKQQRLVTKAQRLQRLAQIQDARKYMAEKAFEEKEQKKSQFQLEREKHIELLKARDEQNRYAAQMTKQTQRIARKATLRRTKKLAATVNSKPASRSSSA